MDSVSHQIPWRTQSSIFSLCMLIIALVYILVTNVLSFKRYGILQMTSEFYTVPYETLKTKQLFYCVISGLVFTIFGMNLFYQIDLI